MEGVKVIMAKAEFWTRVLIDILIILGIILIITSGISIYFQQTRGYGILEMVNNENSEENLAQETLESEDNLELVANSESDLASLQDDFDLNYNRIEGLDNLVEIEIESGMTGLQVAILLDEEGVISYEDFAYLMNEFDLAARIIANQHLLKKDMAISELFSEILLD